MQRLYTTQPIMQKPYNILELQKLSIIELTSICDASQVNITNNFKQGLIYAILEHQEFTAKAKATKSESNARDRYAVADQITSALVVVVLALLLTSCVSYKPGSQSQRRACRATQEIQQYEHSISSGRDCMRPWQNQWQRPQRRVHVPFTNYYIF